LSDTLIQVGGENHGRNLFHQRAISGFDVGRSLRGLAACDGTRTDGNSAGQLGEKLLRLHELQVFVEERVQRGTS
jgi:hypothetical protein